LQRWAFLSRIVALVAAKRAHSLSREDEFFLNVEGLFVDLKHQRDRLPNAPVRFGKRLPISER
jgi:hypothetical protein